MRQKTSLPEQGFFGLSVRSSKTISAAIAVGALFFLGSRADNAYWSNAWPGQAAAQGIDYFFQGLASHLAASIMLCLATAIAGSLAWHYADSRSQTVMLILIWVPWLLASGLAIPIGISLLLD